MGSKYSVCFASFFFSSIEFLSPFPPTLAERKWICLSEKKEIALQAASLKRRLLSFQQAQRIILLSPSSFFPEIHAPSTRVKICLTIPSPPPSAGTQAKSVERTSPCKIPPHPAPGKNSSLSLTIKRKEMQRISSFGNAGKCLSSVSSSTFPDPQSLFVSFSKEKTVGGLSIESESFQYPRENIPTSFFRRWQTVLVFSSCRK